MPLSINPTHPVRLFTVFFYALFFLLLIGCSEKETENATLIFSSSVSFGLGDDLNKTANNSSRKKKISPRNLGPADLTSMIITVTDTEGRFSVSSVLTVGVNEVSFAVPARTKLIISGEAFEGKTLRYRGGSAIAPIKPGLTQSVSFLMYSLDGDLILVDLGLLNKPANGASKGASLSLSQKYVLFTSAATNLIEGDNNDAVDLFLRDLSSDKIINVNASAEGVQANNPDADLLAKTAISADGRFVVFVSASSNLVPDDTNNVPDIFLKDTLTGGIKRINMRLDGTQAILSSDQVDISSDGQIILFFSEDDLLGNDSVGLFFYDRLTQTISSLVRDGIAPRLSGDGQSFVYVEKSTGRLVVFDVNTGVKTVIVDAAGLSENSLSEMIASYEYEISHDGRFIVFVAKEDSIGIIKGQVYLYDNASNGVTLLSANVETILEIENDELRKPSISSDGQFVIFRFNSTIYIKDVLNDLLRVVADGANPFLSLDGQRLGYTDIDGRLLLVTNPLFNNVSESPTAPLEKPANISQAFNEEDGSFTLNWPAVEGGKYYRVYFSSATGITPENYFTYEDGLQLEVGEPSISIPDVFKESGTVYFVITVVNDFGEGLPSDESSFSFPVIASEGDTLTLIYSAGEGGSILGDTPQSVNYKNDGSLVIAVPDTGYLFDKWSDGVTSVIRSDKEVVSNVNVTALFSVIITKSYNVSIDIGAGGTVSPVNALQVGGAVDEGSTVTFTVLPETSFRIDSVSGCGVAYIDNIYTTDLITSSCMIVVSFIENAPPALNYTSAVSVLENETYVTTVSATDADADALTYRINGGLDGDAFNINLTTGELNFSFMPDYESPGSYSEGNVYQVQVVANDGILDSASGLVTVTVENVQEYAPALNDTGFTQCWDGQAFNVCPQSEYPNQDAEFGRDAIFPNDVDGSAGFSYTKLGTQGEVKTGYAGWSCVLDNTTGNVWEAIPLNGEVRKQSSLFTWDEAQAYAQTLNLSGGLCGYNDWRLPKITELVSLVDYSKGGGETGAPAIDSNYFGDTFVDQAIYFGEYWSATEKLDGVNISAAYFVEFRTGYMSFSAKTETKYLRLVRGSQQ